MKIPQRQKRLARRILQLMRLEDPFRRLYRMIVRTHLERRYGNQQEVTLEFHGTEVKFGTHDLYSKRQFLILQDEIYEEPITQLLTERMHHAHTFVDVGANVGYYTCIASKLMPVGRVYAFEMDVDNLALLRQNVQLNQANNVQIIQGAVTDSSEAVRYIKDTDKASVGFGLSGNPDRDHIYGKLVEVQGVVLDEFFRDLQPPDLYKIDVEGAELKVLQGMKRLLTAPKVEIFVEVHPDRILNFGATVRDVITLLINHGFIIHEVPKLAADGSTLTQVTRDTIIRENNLLYAVKS